MAFFWVDSKEFWVIFQHGASEDIGFRRGIRQGGGVWSRMVFGRDGLEEDQIMNGTFFWFGAYFMVWFLVWLYQDLSYQIVLIHGG